MRLVPSALLVMSMVGASFCVVGCADESSPSYELAQKKTPATDDGTTAKTTTPSPTSKPAVAAESFNVRGTIKDSSMAANAKQVKFMALAADGTTTEVTTAPVNSDGTFSASNLSGDQSPTGIFIMSVIGVAQDIIGSGTINGALPLAKGVFIDAPIDALTSLKTNVIQQIASGKVPGLQNYVNVVEAFVNSELLNAVELTDGLSTDITTIVGGISDAIIAGENVIEDTLKKAGINIDFTALQSAQAAVVKGIDEVVNGAKTGVITVGTELVSGIEGAIKDFTGPIDQVLFNAVANGGAAFSNTVKSSGAPTHVAFAASKSSFRLQTALSTSQIKNSFSQTNSSSAVTDALTQAIEKFTGDVDGAQSTDDLSAARTRFTNILLGNSDGQSAAPQCCLLQLICAVVDDVKQIWYQFDAAIKPWAQELEAAFGSCDYGKIGDALSTFDANTQNWQTSLPGLSADSAKSFSKAVRLVQKQIPQ